MLRIGMACFPTVGGSGVVASELALRLAGRGHVVHLFSSAVPFRLRQARGRCHVHVVDPPRRPPLDGSAYSHALAGAIAELSRSEGLDLVHVHYAIPHAPAALEARQIVAAAGRKRLRLVTSLHGTDVTGLGDDAALRAVTRHAVLASDAVTTPSAWLRDVAAKVLDLPAGTRVEVVPNFVEGARPRPADGHPTARAVVRELFPRLSWSGPGRPGVLLHASNFRQLKRVGDAVLALEEVRRVRSAVLLLAGDGPEREGVARLAAEHGVLASVAFLGERPDLDPFLAEADLFLLPSEQESFGLAALEALAAGVPVVASRVGGLPEVVKDGETGLLVPSHDPAAFAAAILALLGDERRRASMGAAARADAEARFRPDPIVDRWEAIYREVAERWE